MQPLPHIGSYYAATVNDVTDFASLQGAQTADVCVIGARMPAEQGALIVKALEMAMENDFRDADHADHAGDSAETPDPEPIAARRPRRICRDLHEQ